MPVLKQLSPGPAAAVEAFEAELRRFVSRRLPGPEGEDALQDTLLRIHESLPTLRDEERLTPWIYRIAHSVVVDHQRRAGRARARWAPEDTAEAQGPAPPAEATGPFAEESLARCIPALLDALPTAQAEALRRCDLGAVPQAVEAARLGVPVPTLKARVRRGRLRLREVLERCCSIALDQRGRVTDFAPRDGCPPDAAVIVPLKRSRAAARTKENAR